MEKCIGIIGEFFGHDFEHIFDEKKSEPTWRPESVSSSMVLANNVERVIELSKSCEKKYVYSICKRCGETIKMEDIEV
jgi:hypothetical protein